MLRLPMVYAVVLLAAGSWSGTQAAAIHKWIDDKGVTHYSDEPPASSEISVTRIDIDTREMPPVSTPANRDNYYSIANQWQRMQRERLQRQQLDLQKAALNAERHAIPEPAPEYRESRATRYLAAYPGRYYRHHRHRPVKRPARWRQTGFQQTKNHIRAGGFPSVN